MKKLIKLIFIKLLFLILVNIPIILSFSLFDRLPIVLDVLILYFIFPILLGLYLSWFASLLFESGKLFSETTLGQGIMLISLVLWVPILIGSYTGVKEYVNLNYTKKHIVAKPKFITWQDIEDSGFITLLDSRLQLDKIASYQNERRYKSGDVYNTTIYDYYASPVISEKGIQFWIVERLSYLKGSSKKPKPKIFQNPVTAGITVHDSRELKEYRIAVESIRKKLNLPSSKNRVYLRYAGNYEDMISTNKFVSILFFSIVNLLFVLLPAFIFSKKI